MIVTKNVKLEGVGRVKKLGIFAIITLLVVLVMALPYAAAIEMVEVNGKMINYTKVSIASDAAWENRTNEQDNITFNAEDLEWILIPFDRKNENEPIFTVRLKTLLDAKEENRAAAGVQSAGGNSGFSGFTEEEKANAIPVPRPEGMDAGANSEDAGEESSSMPAKDKQEAAEAPQSGTESLGSGQDAAKAANSEIASASAAAGTKEPEETMKDKSGEKKESFFVKVLKWLFGR